MLSMLQDRHRPLWPVWVAAAPLTAGVVACIVTRIEHFKRLYREAMASGQSVSAKQLAVLSGYRSYSTFSLAFKQRVGLSVTEWMNTVHKENRPICVVFDKKKESTV